MKTWGDACGWDMTENRQSVQRIATVRAESAIESGKQKAVETMQHTAKRAIGASALKQSLFDPSHGLVCLLLR